MWFKVVFFFLEALHKAPSTPWANLELDRSLSGFLFLSRRSDLDLLLLWSLVFFDLSFEGEHLAFGSISNTGGTTCGGWCIILSRSWRMLKKKSLSKRRFSRRHILHSITKLRHSEQSEPFDSTELLLDPYVIKETNMNDNILSLFKSLFSYSFDRSTCPLIYL